MSDPLLGALVQAGLLSQEDSDRLDRQLNSDKAREYAEQQMLLAFQGGLSAQRDRLIDAIRANDGVLSAAQQNRLWAGENERLWNSVRETILDVASERAVVASIDTGNTDMWEQINEQMVDYAQNYYTSTDAANVGSIPNLNQTSRQRVGQAVTEWQQGVLQEAGLRDGLPQLIRALEPTFGAVRAETIAVTETTRIWTEGIRAAEAENPFTTQWEWLTAADELVCPLCGPRAGQRIVKSANGFATATDALVGFPPIHVRCRCQIVALTDLAADGVPEVVREAVTVTPVAAPVEFIPATSRLALRSVPEKLLQSYGYSASTEEQQRKFFAAIDAMPQPIQAMWGSGDVIVAISPNRYAATHQSKWIILGESSIDAPQVIQHEFIHHILEQGRFREAVARFRPSTPLFRHAVEGANSLDEEITMVLSSYHPNREAWHRNIINESFDILSNGQAVTPEVARDKARDVVEFLRTLGVEL